MPGEDTTSSWKDGIFLKITNIIVYILFLGTNIYTLAAPGDIYHSVKETYLTPASWTFLIWTLIHLLLLGYLFYQFTNAGKALIIDGIGWRFPVLAVFIAIYVHVWATGHYIWAFIVSLFVNSAATHIYWVIKRDHKAGSWADEIFVHLPFSLAHGWITVLVFVTAFEAFGVDARTHAAGVWTKIFVFLALLTLEATAGGYAFTSEEGDLAGAIAITWSLFGIFARQSRHGGSGFVSIVSLIFASLSALWIAISVWKLYKAKGSVSAVLHDAERQPLINN
jgi:hypothetical protein